MWLRTDPYVAYKASKSGVVAFTEQLACALFWCLLRWLALLYDDSPSLADTLAADKIRANVILPGLMDTPVGNKRCCGSFAHKVSRKLLLADGSRHESEGVRAVTGGGGGRARPASAAWSQDGHRHGRGLRCFIPCQRRVAVRHGGDAAGRWWWGARRFSSAPTQAVSSEHCCHHSWTKSYRASAMVKSCARTRRSAAANGATV